MFSVAQISVDNRADLFFSLTGRPNPCFRASKKVPEHQLPSSILSRAPALAERTRETAPGHFASFCRVI
jgi:hypothetical protein